MDTNEIETLTGNERILLAVEPGDQASALIEVVAKLARRLHAEVVVLSVRERAQGRGYVWDVVPVGEVGEVVSSAVYELQRLGVPARGIIAKAPVGRVADEIIRAAAKFHAHEIAIGQSRRGWLGRLLYSSVTPRVTRLATVPVVTIPGRRLTAPLPSARRPAHRYQSAA